LSFTYLFYIFTTRTYTKLVTVVMWWELWEGCSSNTVSKRNTSDCVMGTRTKIIFNNIIKYIIRYHCCVNTFWTPLIYLRHVSRRREKKKNIFKITQCVSTSSSFEKLCLSSILEGNLYYIYRIPPPSPHFQSSLFNAHPSWFDVVEKNFKLLSSESGFLCDWPPPTPPFRGDKDLGPVRGYGSD